MKMECSIPAECGACGHKYRIEISVPVIAKFSGPVIEFSVASSPEELRGLLEQQMSSEKLACRCCGSRKISFPE